MTTIEAGFAGEVPRERDFDIKSFLRAVAASWVRVTALVVAGALIGGTSSLMFTNVYRANAVVMESDDFGAQQDESTGEGIGELASLVGLSIPRSQQTQEAIATLQSRALIEGYIKDQDLLPILFASEWDAERQTWHLHFWQRAPTSFLGYQKIKNKLLDVSEDKKTGLISMSLEWTDPRLAEKWLGDLISRTNAHLRDAAIARSNRNLAYLNSQANKTTVVEIRTAVYRLIEIEIKKAMIAEGSEDYAVRYIDPPALPEQVVFPKKFAFLLLGAFAGAVVGCAWISARMAAG